jgi:hypothetical protein
VQITQYQDLDANVSDKIQSIINFVSDRYISDSDEMSISLDIRGDLDSDGHAVVDPCDEDDDYPLNFELEFSENLFRSVELGGDQFWVTLIHEMIHIKQFALNELRNFPKSIRWNGKFYRMPNGEIDLAKYLEYPWEIEAYSVEKKLYNEWKTFYITLDTTT